jgi:hypothetical protein
MRRVLIVVLLIVAAAVFGLWRTHGGVRQNFSRIITGADESSQGVTGDETRKTFELKPGARVEVQGINGSVEIQTSDTKTAEVVVRRTADSPSSLRRREMSVEQTPDGLLVRSRQGHVGLWEHLFVRDPKEDVTIKAPRQIALSLKGINGRLVAGDIEGPLELKGLNGKVELGQAMNSIQISSVNGNISVGVKQLSGDGARLNGVNGNIELRLASGLNADLTARGMNGSVRSEISEVTVDKEEYGSRYSARIGKGGAPIDIKGINGNLRLTRAESSATGPASDQKSASSTQPEAKKTNKN